MKRITISDEKYSRISIIAESIWQGLKTSLYIFTSFWLVMILLMMFGLINYTSSSALITFTIFFNTVFVSSAIYITYFKPVYGAFNCAVCVVYIYSMLPIVASWSEDKFGTAYLFGIEIADIWGVYGPVLKLTLMITILGAIVKVVSNSKQLTQEETVI